MQVPGVHAGEAQHPGRRSGGGGVGSAVSPQRPGLLGMRTFGWMTRWLGIVPGSWGKCLQSMPELWGTAHTWPLPPVAWSGDTPRRKDPPALWVGTISQ